MQGRRGRPDSRDTSAATGYGFSVIDWTSQRFLDEADTWIRSQVAVLGEIEQPHVRPWSTVLRVPSDGEVLWFKAVGEGHGFEVPLTAILARVHPAAVPELLALDVDRGWMLMRDGGTRLRELIIDRSDLWRWEAFLPEYAELQITVTPMVDEMLAAGVPPIRLADLPERVARLLANHEFLMLDQANGLTRDEHARLEALIPEIVAMCRELAGHGIPETIQHDDLSDGNVLGREGRYRTFDWGDACLSHPFHTLTVLLRAVAYRLDLEPGGVELGRLRDAYLEPFADSGTRDGLELAAGLAYRTGTLARSLAWQRYAESLPPRERDEDLASVSYGLKRFLEQGPIGSWR